MGKSNNKIDNVDEVTDNKNNNQKDIMKNSKDKNIPICNNSNNMKNLYNFSIS